MFKASPRSLSLAFFNNPKTHVRMTRKRNHPLLSLSFISLQVLWLLERMLNMPNHGYSKHHAHPAVDTTSRLNVKAAGVFRTHTHAWY